MPIIWSICHKLAFSKRNPWAYIQTHVILYVTVLFRRHWQTTYRESRAWNVFGTLLHQHQSLSPWKPKHRNIRIPSFVSCTTLCLFLQACANAHMLHVNVCSSSARFCRCRAANTARYIRSSVAGYLYTSIYEVLSYTTASLIQGTHRVWLLCEKDCRGNIVKHTLKHFLHDRRNHMNLSRVCPCPASSNRHTRAPIIFDFGEFHWRILFALEGGKSFRMLSRGYAIAHPSPRVCCASCTQHIIWLSVGV